MAGPSAADLAEHIATILDGDYDDGLEVAVSAHAVDNVMHISLYDEENSVITVFSATFK
jgi:hypothetical protein